MWGVYSRDTVYMFIIIFIFTYFQLQYVLFIYYC